MHLKKYSQALGFLEVFIVLHEFLWREGGIVSPGLLTLQNIKLPQGFAKIPC